MTDTQGNQISWFRAWDLLWEKVSDYFGDIAGRSAVLPNGGYSDAMDGVQERLRPCLERYGFRGRGRNFTRKTPEGLTQVINFQISPWGGSGKFTVNAGVFIPEVYEAVEGKKLRSQVSIIHCSKIERIGMLASRRMDVWWPVKNRSSILADVEGRIQNHVLPFLARFETRASCLGQFTTIELWKDRTEAVLLKELGRSVEAKAILVSALRLASQRGNTDYAQSLRQVAARLELQDVH